MNVIIIGQWDYAVLSVFISIVLKWCSVQGGSQETLKL
jgi:hypothetical protein